MMNRLWKKEENNTDQTNKDEKNQQVKDQTLRTLDIHGIRAIKEARSKSAKIFWLILFLSCTGIFIWQLYKTITNYINSPIVSTYTITTVPAMDFPIVYICPTSMISSEYLNKTPHAEKDAVALKEEMGIMWSYADYLASGNLNGNGTDQTIDDPLAHIDPSALKTMRQKSPKFNHTGPLMESERDAEEFFKNVTVDLENHMRYCEFRVFMSEVFPTCKNITKEVLDPKYGKCYVVDVAGRQQTVQSQALVLTFNVRSLWYPKSSILSPMFNGVNVRIQRKYNVDQSGESILLAPGTYYRVDLSAQHQVFKSFQHPYKQECVRTDDYPAFEIYNVTYTQQACLYDCAAQAIKKACNCILPIDRQLYYENVANETKFCKIKDLKCVREVSTNKKIINELQTCRDQCQRPCEDWRYSIRATSMSLYQYGFGPNIPLHDLIYILVSFSQMEYTEFKQNNSKTADQMIADIGGEASLWIGAGMLTVIQMPLFFVATCGGCFKKANKKLAKRNDDDTNDNESGHSK